MPHFDIVVHPTWEAKQDRVVGLRCATTARCSRLVKFPRSDLAYQDSAGQLASARLRTLHGSGAVRPAFGQGRRAPASGPDGQNTTWAFQSGRSPPRRLADGFQPPVVVTKQSSKGEDTNWYAPLTQILGGQRSAARGPGLRQDQRL